MKFLDRSFLDTFEETNLMDSVFLNIKVTTGILKTNAQETINLRSYIYDVLNHMLITDL